MFDITRVVPSARSTYYNLALFGPEFFWLAVFCFPLFILAWVMGPKIAERFNLSGLDVLRNASAITVAVITLWLMTHGSYSVLRDVSSVSILAAVCLFVCATFLTRRFLEMRMRVSDYISAKIKIKDKWKKRTDWLVPVAAVAVGGLAGAPGWLGFALSGGAVLIGILCGWALNLRKRDSYDFGLVVILLACAITAGIAMQPEFFRFGQMGELTVIHKLALIATGVLLIADLVMRVARPSGKLRDSIYKRLRLGLRLVALLAALLFMFTESALILGVFCAIVAALIYLNIRHIPKGGDLSVFKRVMFLAAVGMFGILISVPLLPFAAIALYKSTVNSQQSTAWKSLL
ncbi:hypothetical protein FACS189421_07030 [Bacteroidia bacterium]|nr:hypothetical protein FACS189421_07030 [Bacteroidia bacterium]